VDYLTTTDIACAAFLTVHGFPPDEIESIDITYSLFRWKSEPQIAKLLEEWEYGTPTFKAFFFAYRRLIDTAIKQQRREFGGNRNA